jgi:hypothetical protein
MDSLDIQGYLDFAGAVGKLGTPLGQLWKGISMRRAIDIITSGQRISALTTARARQSTLSPVNRTGVT